MVTVICEINLSAETAFGVVSSEFNDWFVVGVYFCTRSAQKRV